MKFFPTLILSILAISSAHAAKYCPPKTPVKPVATPTQTQAQSQNQTTTSNANGGPTTSNATGGASTSNAIGGTGGTGGNSNATGGTGLGGTGQGGAGGFATNDAETHSAATNAGNNTDIDARSAPSFALPSFAIQGCSVAVSAGGSNLHGGLGLGLAFTPKECKQMEVAQAYQALGMYEAACNVIVHTKTMKALLADGMPEPNCKPVPVAVVVPQGYTRAQVDTIVKKAVSK